MQTFAEKESCDFSDLETDELFIQHLKSGEPFFGFSIEKPQCNTIGNRKDDAQRRLDTAHPIVITEGSRPQPRLTATPAHPPAPAPRPGCHRRRDR